MSRWLQQSFIYSGYIVKTHFKLLGMINLFSSVNVIFLFILFFSPGALQPVSRWNLSFPSLWSYPGGWPRAVWLCTGPHWCQTSCSQDPGDSKQDVKIFLECSITINAVTWLYSISKLQRAVSGSVFEEFPSVIALEMLPRVTDPSPAKRMIGQLLSSIRSSGRSRFHAVNLIILDEAHLTAHVEVYEAEN